MEILCSIRYREKNTFEVTNCDLKDGGTEILGAIGTRPREDRMGEDNTSNLMLNLTLNLLRLKV